MVQLVSKTVKIEQNRTKYYLKLLKFKFKNFKDSIPTLSTVEPSTFLGWRFFCFLN
jgi:hypothetical protein